MPPHPFWAKPWQLQAIARDEPTRASWIALYESLTADRDGLAGDVLARTEAQVLRLSKVYALLAGSRLIRSAHLQAAVAVWDYAAATVEYIFGQSSGDAVADDILRHLAQAGELSRSEINNRLGRNVRGDRLRLALDALERSGQVARRMVAPDGERGRPTEMWQATGKSPVAGASLLPRLNSLVSFYSSPDATSQRKNDGP